MQTRPDGFSFLVIGLKPSPTLLKKTKFTLNNKKIKHTSSIPNYKTFELFIIITFIYTLRYIVYKYIKNIILEKSKHLIIRNRKITTYTPATNEPVVQW